MCYFIYAQLKSYLSSNLFSIEKLFDLLYRSKFALIFVILLMPINWFVEAIKWKYICKQHQIKMSYKEAYGAVFFGACIGFISPGRWGEPIARAYYIGKENTVQKISLSMIGIISQWIITILMVLFSFSQMVVSEISIPFIFMFVFLVLFFYYEIIFNFIFLKLFPAKKIVLSVTKILDKIIVFLISLFRYLIYTIQYLLLIEVFTVTTNLYRGLLNIFQLFFYQSFSPLPGLVDYTFKNNIALFLFQKNGMNVIEILFVIFIIWLINLVFPSLIGYVLFSKKINSFMKNRY